MSERTDSIASSTHTARLFEDAFFLEQDRVLIERLRAMRKMAETKESLAEVSGITNDAILSRLVDLDVRPESLAALAAVPLVEVAWADGEISPAERTAVLSHAETKGIRADSMEHDLLSRWLTHRPDPSLLEAWQAYIHGLCEGLSCCAPHGRRLRPQAVFSGSAACRPRNSACWTRCLRASAYSSRRPLAAVPRSRDDMLPCSLGRRRPSYLGAL
jgi:hypothetical protein